MTLHLTVDLIVQHPSGIVIIERKSPPAGFALPGGHVDEGETVEDAAARELKEETSLDAVSLSQFHVYSDPRRDPRGHYVTVVFSCTAQGSPLARSDAKKVLTLSWDEIDARKDEFAFDHYRILQDYRKDSGAGSKRSGNA